MDRSPPQPYLPMRFIHYRQYSQYFAYGNTPAENFLEHVHFEDEREPIVLSLGCGDIRSLFYTLWKHFDPSLSRRHFSGVHFVLNDISAAVLARNILFLYLTANMPSWNAGEAAKQWISNLWAIWYCHELLPDHERTLKEALDALVHYSGTMECWKSSTENPLRRLVSFTNAETLRQVRATWEMWRTKSFGSIESMKTERSKLLSPSKNPHFVDKAESWLKATHGQCIPETMYDTMVSEYTYYERNGSAFAEECLSLSYSTTHTVVNPTLFEREDGMYTFPTASVPYEGFVQGFLMSKSQVKRLGAGLEIAGQPLVVEDHSFQKHPLLSNCIQQFSIWVSSVAATLRAQSSRMKLDISFVFDCSHCILFCEKFQSNPQLFLTHTGIQPSFDVIYTSNLIDYLSPPVLIHACMPLLKKNRCLLTNPFLYRNGAPSAEKYLHNHFGFSSEMLPLISGVRCIGHDGTFTDNTSIIPQFESFSGGVTVPFRADLRIIRYDKVLIWQGIDSLPMKIGALDMQLSQILHGAVHTSVISFYDKDSCGSALITKRALCTETAINTILLFASQLDATVDISDHRFWDSLCSLMREDAPLRPFLVHLQTQALLHDLHFHLTLSESECPLCLKKPIEEVVSQFFIEFDPPFKMEHHQPTFTVHIHKTSNQILGPDHLVDSAQSEVLLGGNIQLIFFFPTQFVKDHYFVTICMAKPVVENEKAQHCDVISLSRKLIQLRVSYQSVPYSFKQAGATRTKSTFSSLGCVLRHCGDADHMETLLSLSPKALSFKKAIAEQLSPSKLDVVCGNHHLTIDYPYSVDHSRTKVSHSKGTMKITAPRKCYHVYEEKPVFFVNPNHILSLPTLQVADEILARLCKFQFPKDDLHIQNYAMHNVKLFLRDMFRQTQVSFITLVSPHDQAKRKTQSWAFVFVHRRAVDATKRSPILDVSYIVDAPEEIRIRWLTMVQEIRESSTRHVKLFLDEEKWQVQIVLKQVFKHFANRTLPTSKNPSRILRKHGLDKFFTRAVLYPLYLDQDTMSKVHEEVLIPTSYAATTSNASPSSSSTAAARTTTSPESRKDQNKCSFCGNTSEKLRKCTGCGSTWYCGKECQTRHWRQHKTVCKPTTHTTTALPSPFLSSFDKTISASSTAEAKEDISHPSMEEPSECNFCGNTSEKLRKCTGCGSTWYCGKECQIRHWKQHKTVCKPPVIPAAMALPSKCASCGKDSANLKRCACQFVAYCSKECQRNDWTRHRTNCTASTRSKK